jgi:hypothetical protein
MLHVCYIADTNIGVGQYGPFEFQFGSASPAYSCWDKDVPPYATCSEYGNIDNLCVDSDITDSVLECNLPLPSGSQGLEFTVHHLAPMEYWWSDELDYAQGGDGATIGTVVLTCPNGSTQAFTLQMNYLQIPGLMNGYVATVCP